MSAPESINWLLTLILILVCIATLVAIVFSPIPKIVAVKLTYIVKVIWGTVP